MLSQSLLSQVLITVLIAGLVSFAGTPLSVFFARRFGFLAKPKPDRFHIITTPMVGGLAIWAAFACSLAFFGISNTSSRQLVAIILGATLMMLVGMWDDRYGLGPRSKIIGQALAGLILLVGGVQVTLFSIVWLDGIITIFWVIAISNAINLQDNMDGLAAGISACTSASVLILAALHGQLLVASVSAAVLGACLGFLFYNFQPAVTFMGDTGSLLLGFVLAVLSILLAFPSIPRQQTWIAPILVLAIPLFDTALVMFSRARRKVPFWRGGTDHTSHRLVYLGLSHRRSVLLMYAVSIFLGLLAVIAVDADGPFFAWALAVFLAVIGGGLIFALEHVYNTRHNSGNLRVTMRIAVLASGQNAVRVLAAIGDVSRSAQVLLVTEDLADPWVLQAVNALGQNKRAMKLLSPHLQTIVREQGQSALSDVLAGLHMFANIHFVNPREHLDKLLVQETLLESDLFLATGDLEQMRPLLQDLQVALGELRLRRPRILLHSAPATILPLLKSYGLDSFFTQVVSTVSASENEEATVWSGDQFENSQIALLLPNIWLMRERL